MMEDEKRPDTVAEDNPLSSFETVDGPQPAAKRRKLNRNTRTLIIAVAIMAVLAILVAISLPLLSPQQGGSSAASSEISTPETVYPLYDRSNDKTNKKTVQSVTVSYAGDTYTVYYHTARGLYVLRGYEDLLLGSTVDELIGCATTLNAYDRVHTTTKLADFGLEKPVATVAITYHDNSVGTLHIGNVTPTEDGCYARMTDSDTVYMLDIDTASLFKQSKTTLIERTILAPPTVKQDDKNGSVVLKELTIIGGPSGQTLTVRQAEASDGVEYSYASFIITKPYTRMVDETLSSTLESFTYIISSDAAVLHPTAADKAAYGFTKPYATLKITLAVQTLDDSTASDSDPAVRYYNAVQSTLTVGKKDSDGNYYVMIDDHNAIYHVAASLLSPVVERTYENTVSELLFLKDITTIGQLSVSQGGKQHTLAITHDAKKENSDDQLTVKLNGQKLGTPDFRRLYSQMMGISRYDKAAAKPTGQASYTITLRTVTGKTFLSLNFYKQSGSLYTVRTTEGELFTVKASTIDQWITQFNNYIAGKGVADI